MCVNLKKNALHLNLEKIESFTIEIIRVAISIANNYIIGHSSENRVNVQT